MILKTNDLNRFLGKEYINELSEFEDVTTEFETLDDFVDFADVATCYKSTSDVFFKYAKEIYPKEGGMYTAEIFKLSDYEAFLKSLTDKK
jgi:hypothetical protein